MADGKTLLITGASSGIGAATARAAARAGFRVALAARTREALDELAGELGADHAAAFVCDVTNYEAQEALVTQTVERFGRLDAVFANAGVGLEPGGFSSAPVASWRHVIETNVLGVAYTIRAALPAIKKAKGHVVITGSVAGRRSFAGSMYGVSKWAVSAIGYNLREELIGTGVRVTLLEPGMVDTPFFDDPKPDALTADNVADTVVFALTQPAGVDLHEILVMPTPPVSH